LKGRKKVETGELLDWMNFIGLSAVSLLLALKRTFKLQWREKKKRNSVTTTVIFLPLYVPAINDG
jgi:hypothetical protein